MNLDHDIRERLRKLEEDNLVLATGKADIQARLDVIKEAHKKELAEAKASAFHQAMLMVHKVCEELHNERSRWENE